VVQILLCVPVSSEVEDIPFLWVGSGHLSYEGLMKGFRGFLRFLSRFMTCFMEGWGKEK
jgi:hypothetical protein